MFCLDNTSTTPTVLPIHTHAHTIPSSYRVPDLDRGELARQYRELAAALAGQAAGVDLLLAETLCSSKEAAAAAEAAAAVGKPLWLSFTIDDEVAASRLRGGEALGAAVAAAVAACSACGADLRAVMVNCSHPAAVGAALKQLRGLPLPEGESETAWFALC